MKVSDDNARNFYIKETINSNWSVRELRRQISMYVNYYDRKIKSVDENKTISILLCTNETVVKYSLLLDNKQIYAANYKLNIPSKDEFINEIEKEKQNYFMNK